MWLQVFPVERRLACSRTAAQQHNVQGIILCEPSDFWLKLVHVQVVRFREHVRRAILERT